MFKIQYNFLAMKSKKKSNVEQKIISKRDEEKIKNIIKEQPKIRQMLNANLENRNDF